MIRVYEYLYVTIQVRDFILEVGILKRQRVDGLFRSVDFLAEALKEAMDLHQICSGKSIMREFFLQVTGGKSNADSDVEADLVPIMSGASATSPSSCTMADESVHAESASLRDSGHNSDQSLLFLASLQHDFDPASAASTQAASDYWARSEDYVSASLALQFIRSNRESRLTGNCSAEQGLNIKHVASVGRLATIRESPLPSGKACNEADDDESLADDDESLAADDESLAHDAGSSADGIPGSFTRRQFYLAY